jgi:hypothetical protein
MPCSHRLIGSMLLAAVLALGASGAASAAPRHHPAVHHNDHAGSCGEYMYWHDGRCVDTRNRPGSDWSGAMSSKQAW